MSFMGLMLQKAMYDRLKNSPYMSGYRIYDTPPENPQLPYVVIGEGETKDWSTKTVRGYEVVMDVNVWSDYRGFKEAKEIMSAIDRAIMEARLQVDGAEVVSQVVDRYLIRDENGIKHGVLSFKIKVLEGG